ncbi:MAG: tetratricopeptide repeat protein, partial [Nannocystaceae bacterium]
MLVACEQKPAVSLHQGTVSNADIDPAPKTDERIDEWMTPATGWFEDPRGAEVISARQRGDEETATTLLRALLDSEALSSHDRAGALVLFGREALAAGRYDEAFTSFGEAAEARDFAAIAAQLTLWQAEAALRGNKPDAAKTLLEGLEVSPTYASERAALWMRAIQRVGTDEEAQASLEQFLEQYPEHDQRFEARDALARRIEATDPARARDLYERVILAVPLSTFADRAREGIERLDKISKGRPPRAERRSFEREAKVAKLESELGRRRYRSVVKDADALLKTKSLTKPQRCRVAYARAKAIFRQRKRAQARVPFDAAGVACEAADDWNLVVKARYQSARGRYAAGEYPAAAKAFMALADAFPKHSYADDALLLAGESWDSAGEVPRAEAAWASALERFPEGDMRGEIQRRLMLSAFNSGNPERVLQVVEAALVAAKPGRAETAKLHYFQARALDLLGRGGEALRAYFAAGQMRWRRLFRS